MPQNKQTKKIKVRDLKPRKDPKGGVGIALPHKRKGHDHRQR